MKSSPVSLSHQRSPASGEDGAVVEIVTLDPPPPPAAPCAPCAPVGPVGPATLESAPVAP